MCVCCQLDVSFLRSSLHTIQENRAVTSLPTWNRTDRVCTRKNKFGRLLCVVAFQNTALHLCAQLGNEAPTNLLLNNGADLRLQNIYGKFPLDVAIENKQENVAKAILSCKR